jgi:hypothetical protein
LQLILKSAYTGIGLCYLEQQNLIPAISAFSKAHKFGDSEESKRYLETAQALLGDITKLNFDIDNLVIKFQK